MRGKRYESLGSLKCDISLDELIEYLKTVKDRYGDTHNDIEVELWGDGHGGSESTIRGWRWETDEEYRASTKDEKDRAKKRIETLKKELRDLENRV